MEKTEITGLLAVCLFIAACLGYVFNVMQLAQADHVTGMVILRAVGIFLAPLGCVLGYL
jgi:hypothetical protein